MKNTSEQVTVLIERLRNTPNWLRDGFVDWKDAVLTHDRSPFKAADMLEDYAAILRERESAKAAVTSQMRATACDAYDKEMVGHGETANPVAMRAALEAVAPMLASARVPDSEWLELADVLDKFIPTGGPGPLWSAGASFAYSDAAKTIRAKLAAARSPRRRSEGWLTLITDCATCAAAKPSTTQTLTTMTKPANPIMSGTGLSFATTAQRLTNA